MASRSKGTKGALAKAVFNCSKDTSFSVINSAKGSKDLGRGVVPTELKCVIVLPRVELRRIVGRSFWGR